MINPTRKLFRFNHARTIALPTGQRGVSLIFALVALAVVTFLGISNARNSQFQMLSANAFSHYIQTDAAAESSVRCVILWAEDNFTEFSEWVTEVSDSADKGTSTASIADYIQSGDKTELALNQAVTGKSSGRHSGCMSKADAAKFSETAEGLEADVNNFHASAEREASADGATAVKDTTYFCGWSGLVGNELGSFGTLNLVTAGDAQINAEGGAKTMSATVWQAFGPLSNELYDEATGGYQYGKAHQTDVICEV